MNIKIYMGLFVIVHIMLVDFAVNHVEVMDILEDWSDISLLLHVILCGSPSVPCAVESLEVKFSPKISNFLSPTMYVSLNLNLK